MYVILLPLSILQGKVYDICLRMVSEYGFTISLRESFYDKSKIFFIEQNGYPHKWSLHDASSVRHEFWHGANIIGLESN